MTPTRYNSIADSDSVFSVTSGNRSNEMFDVGAFLACTLLTALGLISIYSATYDAGSSEYFIKQLIYAGVGVVMMVVIMFMPERWMMRLSYPAYTAGIVLLIAVLTPLGREVYGSKSWIALGAFSFQPSELSKVSTLLAAAAYISQKGRDIRTMRDLGVMVALILAPVGLIMLEPDFGSATVYISMLVGLLLWSGLDLAAMFAIAGLPIIAVSSFFGDIAMYVVGTMFSVGAALFRRGFIVTMVMIGLFVAAGLSSSYMYHIMKPHQKARIQTFLDPDSDPKGKGYNVIQSILAVGSGGLTGKGFLQGTQTQLRYIPKQWTDFIFCVPTEEFGFAGGVSVIVLMFFLIYRAVDAATTAPTRYGSTLCFGIAILYFYHATVNIGMAIGLFPVMGIPLPFLSAGGSSLVINMSMVGIILNVYRQKSLRSRKS